MGYARNRLLLSELLDIFQGTDYVWGSNKQRPLSTQQEAMFQITRLILCSIWENSRLYLHITDQPMWRKCARNTTGNAIYFVNQSNCVCLYGISYVKILWITSIFKEEI